MNDRYLFRAKRIDNGEWVIGFYHWTNWINPQTKEIAEVTHSILPIDCQDSYYVDQSTICQCTGLKDKNGKLIWENDVLLQKTTGKHWCQWECMGVVKYGEHDWNVSEYGFTSLGFYIEPIVRNGNINKIACGLNQVDINDEFYPTEVIGNIFDNPELMYE